MPQCFFLFWSQISCGANLRVAGTAHPLVLQELQLSARGHEAWDLFYEVNSLGYGTLGDSVKLEMFSGRGWEGGGMQKQGKYWHALIGIILAVKMTFRMMPTSFVGPF